MFRPPSVSLSSILKPKFDIDGQKYSILNQIGEGGFAFVYRVKKVSNSILKSSSKSEEHFAVKKMICQAEEQIEEANKEISILKLLNHPNVLPLLGSAQSVNKKGQTEIVLLLPLYGGTVQSIIDKALERNGGYPLCPFQESTDIIEISRGVVDGLIALHTAGYRHGDLKPANVLLSQTSGDRIRAVLTDFGSVSTIPVTVTNRHVALDIQDQAASFTTASIRSPELFDCPSHDDIIIDGRTDVWSFGCTLYAMMFNKTPFEDPIQGLSTLSAMSGNYTVPSGHPWPADYIHLIERCLTVSLAAYHMDPHEAYMKRRDNMKESTTTATSDETEGDRDNHNDDGNGNMNDNGDANGASSVGAGGRIHMSDVRLFLKRLSPPPSALTFTEVPREEVESLSSRNSTARSGKSLSASSKATSSASNSEKASTSEATTTTSGEAAVEQTTVFDANFDVNFADFSAPAWQNPGGAADGPGGVNRVEDIDGDKPMGAQEILRLSGLIGVDAEKAAEFESEEEDTWSDKGGGGDADNGSDREDSEFGDFESAKEEERRKSMNQEAIKAAAAAAFDGDDSGESNDDDRGSMFREVEGGRDDKNRDSVNSVASDEFGDFEQG